MIHTSYSCLYSQPTSLSPLKKIGVTKHLKRLRNKYAFRKKHLLLIQFNQTGYLIVSQLNHSTYSDNTIFASPLNRLWLFKRVGFSRLLYRRSDCFFLIHPQTKYLETITPNNLYLRRSSSMKHEESSETKNLPFDSALSPNRNNMLCQEPKAQQNIIIS